MEKKAYLYTVVKYVHDLLKNEPKNIGVIVQCSDLGYINCRFLTNLHAKLGCMVSNMDLKIVRAYIDEFTNSFSTSAEYPSSLDFLQGEVEFLNDGYLYDLFRKGLGKIQFSEPRGGLTDNPEKELGYLFNTFIGEERARGAVKHSMLKTEIKTEFKRNKWVATHHLGKFGFEIDFKISKGKSNVEYPFDFALKNGKLHLMETVDLRKKDKKLWDAETFKTALKFDDLSHGVIEQHEPYVIEPYSIVALPEHEDTNFHLKILKAYSNVFIYTNSEEKSKFLSKMRELVSGPDLI